jgi:hypothetical protein
MMLDLLNGTEWYFAAYRNWKEKKNENARKKEPWKNRKKFNNLYEVKVKVKLSL